MIQQAQDHQRVALVLDAGSEHSLRNHLAVVIGFCELVLTVPPSDPISGDIHEIRRAATEALAIVTNGRVK